MYKSKRKNKGRLENSSSSRKGAVKIHQRKNQLHQRGVHGGGRRGGTIDSPESATSPVVLINDFEPISRLEIEGADMIDRTNHHEAITFADGLPTLYKCVSRMKDFHDKKEWSSVPGTDKLSAHVIAKVRRFRPKGYKWSFCRDVNGTPRLVYWKQLRCSSWQYLFPLDWLPMLNKQNEALHDLTVEVLRMIAHDWKIPVIRNRFNEEIIAGKESGGHLGEVELVKYDRASYYGHGMARHYEKLLRERPTISLETLKKRITNKPWGKTQAAQSVSWWLDYACDAIKGAQDIKHFYACNALGETIMDSSEKSGFPLRPEDYFGFVWSFNDTIYNETLSNMRSVKEGIGYCDPVAQIELYPSRNGVTSTTALEVLGRFIDKGIKTYSHYYRKRIEYHRKKVELAYHPMKAKMQRSPYLIDILR